MGFPSSSEVENPPAMQEPQETQVHSLNREDPLEDNGNPLRYSRLGNPIWWATAHGVAQSLTRLEQVSTHTCLYMALCLLCDL